MTSDRLQSLTALDQVRLAPVVQRALASPGFELGLWRVRRLSDQGIMNPDGLFVFSGEGRDESGPRAWSVVLKILRAYSPELPPDHLWHWGREVSVFESGFLDRLPGPLAAPRVYGVERQPDGAWLWMEHIADQSPRRWGMGDFVFAAEQLGRSTGAWLGSGRQAAEAWLCRSHSRTWAEGFLPTDETWAHDYVRELWLPPLRQRLLALLAERERLYAALERLPQTFAHFDPQRRNLLIRARPDGSDELVAVDWAWCGLGPVGAELANLIGGSLMLFEAEPEPALEEAVLAAYLAGLRAAGWRGRAQDVRLAYLAALALFCGSTTPQLTLFWTSADRIGFLPVVFGREAAACAAGWAAMAALALERGEEALKLLE